MVEVSAGSSVRSPSREKSGIKYRSEDDIKVLDARRIVEKVREVRGDPDALTNELPALPLPGHGDAYDDCGDSLEHFCTACGEVHAVGRTCRRKECPRCAPAWVVDRATAVASKLEATRRYLYSKRGQSPRFHHLVFSPPDGFAVARDDPLAAGYEVVKEMLDELGADGGVIVYHPWRGAEDDDRGFWKEVLFKGNEWGETVERLEYGPHFHVVAVGRFVAGQQFTKRLNEKTGWVYKRITKGGDDTESNVSLYDEYDLARALTYTLSHAGVTDEADAYRYTGTVANLAAEDHIEEDMSAVVRSVAPNTLGLSWSSTSCQRELDEDEEAATEASSPSNPDPERADDDGDQEERTRRCGGRYEPISRAPGYLTDSGWRERVGPEAVERVVRSYAEWRGVPPPP